MVKHIKSTLRLDKQKETLNQSQYCFPEFESLIVIKTVIQYSILVYDRNHLFGLGSNTETETENWPKLSADTKTNRNQKILNWKVLYQGVCKNFMSCQLLNHLFGIPLISIM